MPPSRMPTTSTCTTVSMGCRLARLSFGALPSGAASGRRFAGGAARHPARARLGAPLLLARRVFQVGAGAAGFLREHRHLLPGLPLDHGREGTGVLELV